MGQELNKCVLFRLGSIGPCHFYCYVIKKITVFWSNIQLFIHNLPTRTSLLVSGLTTGIEVSSTSVKSVGAASWMERLRGVDTKAFLDAGLAVKYKEYF